MTDDKTDKIPMAECGSCRAVIALDSKECSECGIQFSGVSDESLGECGGCKALVPLDSKSCPKCGVYFVADDVIDVLRKWFNDTGVEISTLFGKMDTDGDGVINPVELKDGLLKLNLADLPPSQVDRLVSKLDKDSDGMISLDELVYSITGEEATDSESPEVSGAESTDAKEYSENVVIRLMKKHSIADKEAFLAHAADFDANDNGYLTEPELKAAAESFVSTSEDVEVEEKTSEEVVEDQDDSVSDNDSNDEVESEEDDSIENDIEHVEEDIIEETTSQSPLYKLGVAALNNDMSIREMFESMDSDDDGRIDGPELQKGIEDLSGDALSPAEIFELLESLDEDSDGRIDPMELVTAIESLDMGISADIAVSAPKDPVLILVEAMDEAGANPASIFRSLDKNGDGNINIEELRQRVNEVLAESLSDDEVDQLFNRLDEDGNGSIDMIEFIETLENVDEDLHDEETSLSSKSEFPSKRQAKLMSKKWNDVFWPLIHTGLFIFIVMWLVNGTIAPFVDGSGGMVDLDSEFGMHTTDDGVTYLQGDTYPCDDSAQTDGCKNSLTPLAGEGGEISMPAGFYWDGILFTIIGTLGLFGSLIMHFSIVPGWRARARAIKDSKAERQEVEETISKDDEDDEDGTEGGIDDEISSEDEVVSEDAEDSENKDEDDGEGNDGERDDDAIDIGSHIGLTLDGEEIFGVITEFDDDENLVTIEEDGTGDLVTGYQDDMFLED